MKCDNFFILSKKPNIFTHYLLLFFIIFILFNMASARVCDRALKTSFFGTLLMSNEVQTRAHVTKKKNIIELNKLTDFMKETR